MEEVSADRKHRGRLTEDELKEIIDCGRNPGVLKARMLFGEADISEVLRHVIFKDVWSYRSSAEIREVLRSFWEKSLKELQDTNLPEDLEFTRRLLEIILKVLTNEAKVSD